MFDKLIMPFWNRKDSRLRMFWRVILLLVLWASVQRSTFFLPFSYRIGAILMSALILLGGFSLIIDRRSLRDYGFQFNRATLPDFLFGLILGGLLVSIIVAIEKLMGWLIVEPGAWTRNPTGPFSEVFVTALFYYLAISISEEAVFRGYLLPNFAEGFRWLKKNHLSRLLAVLLAGILFGWIHFDNPAATTLSGINLTLYGLLLAVPFLTTGSLAVSIGLHLTWNFFIGVVYGLPVSGYPPYVALMQIRQGGPEVWTGGDFGPEGGLLTTVILLVELAAFLIWVQATRGKIVIHPEFGEYHAQRVFAMTPEEIQQERYTLLGLSNGEAGGDPEEHTSAGLEKDTRSKS